MYAIGTDTHAFSKLMAEQGCQVLALDPSGPPSPDWKDSGYTYERVGIGTRNGMHVEGTSVSGAGNFPVETLSHIMKREHHTKINILRMDVGGNEWPVLEQWCALESSLSQRPRFHALALMLLYVCLKAEERVVGYKSRAALAWYLHTGVPNSQSNRIG